MKYDYIKWPCNAEDIEYRDLILLPNQGIQIRQSLFKLKYLDDEKYSVCDETQPLSATDINTIMFLIDEEFYYEMWIDNLPV